VGVREHEREELDYDVRAAGAPIERSTTTEEGEGREKSYRRREGRKQKGRAKRGKGKTLNQDVKSKYTS